jgi:hypothetical protein
VTTRRLGFEPADSHRATGTDAIQPVNALRPAAWLLIALAVVRTHADPDLWGHVRFGLDMLRDRALTTVDPYSFTQDVPWTNHEWLSELAMGMAFRHGGATGLLLLKAIVLCVAFVVMWRGLRDVAAPWRWGGLALVALAAHPLTLTIRPQLWTMLLLVVLCRLLVAGGPALWAIPLLFVPWANFHGGWILGLGIVGAWSAGRLVDRADRREGMQLAAVAALSALATLVNPYGMHMWEFIGTTVRLSRADITEWQPIWRHSVAAVASWTMTAAFVVVHWRRHGRPPAAQLLVLLMLALASIRVMRLVALFAPAAVLLLAPRLPRASKAAAVPRGQTLLDAVIVGAVFLGSFRTGVVAACPVVETPSAPDMPALAALAEARRSGRMVTAFDWGQAALASVGPALKVSVDGRRETVYTPATLQAQYQMQLGTDDGLRTLETLSPDYVWLPLPDARRTRDWLVQHGYRIDVETSRSFVASRASLRPITPAADVMVSPCFPGVPFALP